MDLSTVQFRPLPWASYQRLKKLVEEAVSGNSVRVLLRLLATEAGSALLSGNGSSLSAADLQQLKSLAEENLKDVVEEAMGAADEVQSIVISGCVEGDVDLSGLSATDVLQIRDKAFEAADFASIWALEKNWWAGLTKQVGQIFGGSPSDPPVAA